MAADRLSQQLRVERERWEGERENERTLKKKVENEKLIT